MTEEKKKSISIQAIMDKVTAQSLGILFIIAGIFISFDVALILYGIDVAVTVITSFAMFIGIVGVYFGLVVADSKTQQLLNIIQAKDSTIDVLVKKPVLSEEEITLMIKKILKEQAPIKPA